MGDPIKSKDTWQKALDALPKENLTPAEETQKQQYTAGLNAAIATIARFEDTAQNISQADPRDRGAFVLKDDGQLPWDIARATVERLRAQQRITVDVLHSSVRVEADILHPLMVYRLGSFIVPTRSLLFGQSCSLRSSSYLQDFTRGLNSMKQLIIRDHATGMMEGMLGVRSSFIPFYIFAEFLRRPRTSPTALCVILA